MKKENRKRLFKIIGLALSAAALVAGGIAIGKYYSELSPEITELNKKIKELEVECAKLEKENHRLLKRIESLLYHLGQVVESARNKSYQL